MDLFNNHGAHVLVDGQFGSTGKGALAAWLASRSHQPDWAAVLTSAGPNSGHTFYHEGEKVVLKQLPTFAVAKYLLTGKAIPVVLTAGAVVDEDILTSEALKYPEIPIYVHPNAVRLTDQDRESEHSGTIAAVAGTRSGTGAAIGRKVARDPKAVMHNTIWGKLPSNVRMLLPYTKISPLTAPYFMEVSQGFSLGINSQFYPKVTSRECTVMQAMADARFPARSLAKVYMSCRTLPIRVGNVDGFSSGDWYPDQRELNWDSLGVEPERTTVTNRIRRIASFSRMQFLEALQAHDPDVVFMNFLNYLPEEEIHSFVRELRSVSTSLTKGFSLVGGFGPTSGDIRYV